MLQNELDDFATKSSLLLKFAHFICDAHLHTGGGV